jgi:hypothetical protein
MSRPHDQGAPGASSFMDAAIYARVSTEDQGKGFSIPTQIEAGQVMAARCTDNWQAHARHSQPHVGRGVRQ